MSHLVKEQVFPEFKGGLSDSVLAQKRFQKEANELLDEIGQSLEGRRVIRHYEIDGFPPVKSDPGEVTAVYFNRAHARSVFVWIGQSMGSARHDDLSCTIQLRAKPAVGEPGARHSQKLSTVRQVDIRHDSIRDKIVELLQEDAGLTCL